MKKTMMQSTEQQSQREEESQLLSLGTVLKDKWQLIEKIGGGGFGEIYKAKDMTNNEVYAVKAESCTTGKQVLRIEALILKRLQGISQICEYQGCGRTDKANFVVMTLLGANLSDLRKKQQQQRLSISTVLRLSVQVIRAVQAMHNCGFLHRDLKPSNFAMGIGVNSRRCYLLDFGLARQYTTPTGELKQPRPVAGFRGTVRYASLNAHLGFELGRHDDLWSLFYMLVELATGQLPWRRMRDKETAGKVKQEYDHRKLVTTLPSEFRFFMDHLKQLSYFDKPNYHYLISLFEKAQQRLGINESDPFDWEHDSSIQTVTSMSGISPPIVSPEHQASPEALSSIVKGSERSTGKEHCQHMEVENVQQSSHIESNYIHKTDHHIPFNTTECHQYCTQTQQHTIKPHDQPCVKSGLLSNKLNGLLRSKNHQSLDEKVSCSSEAMPIAPLISESNRFNNAFQDDSKPLIDGNGIIDGQKHESQENKIVHVLNIDLSKDGSTDNEDTVSTSETNSEKNELHVLRSKKPLKAEFQNTDVTPHLTSNLAVNCDTPLSKVNHQFGNRVTFPTGPTLCVPRPPTNPPPAGYFCSSGRRRKFVRISCLNQTSSIDRS